VKIHHFERQQMIAKPRSLVFQFFKNAGNLPRITPEFVQFTFLTPMPTEMRVGALIDYRLRMFHVPFTWRSRIDEYEPEVRFMDNQLEGPYEVWRHTHLFADVPAASGEAPSATVMTDRIEYAVGMGPLGEVANGLFVRATIERVFDYRRRAIAALPEFS
jgi:ligand-binding SRPBCC domain-containing protein